jgi:hypothetical protein
VTLGDVHTLHLYHPQIRAEDWRSPLTRRLLGCDEYSDGDKVFEDSFRDENSTIKESQIRLRWTGLKDDFGKCIKTYQSPVLTEYATLGLSCILLEKRAKLEVTEVTLRGERADYWLGEKEMLLESSGQQTGNLAQLQTEKAQQLRDNPFEKHGYVCVVNYQSCRAQLWFHAYE